MKFYYLTNNSHVMKDLPLDEYEHFFMAHAVVTNGKLTTYLNNHKKWFMDYGELWHHDPIVTQPPSPQEKLKLTSWVRSHPLKKFRDFSNARYERTQCYSGFTAYRTIEQEPGLVRSEFYAVGLPKDSPRTAEFLYKDCLTRQILTSLFEQVNNYDEKLSCFNSPD